MLVSAFHMIRDQQDYRDLGPDPFEHPENVSTCE